MSLIDLRYIEMPLSIHYFLNEKVQLELGLSPDVLLKERYEDEDGIEVPSRSGIESLWYNCFCRGKLFYYRSVCGGNPVQLLRIPILQIRALMQFAIVIQAGFMMC